MNGEQQLAAFRARRAAWCKATELRHSPARLRKVLPWLPPYSSPKGLDHTAVYYSPRWKFHLLLTEPYHSAELALASVQSFADAYGKGFSYAFGRQGVGLWNPGPCRPLLIAIKGAGVILEEFAARLPAADE